MQTFFWGVVIGVIGVIGYLKVNQSKKNHEKSKALFDEAAIYLKNGWFLGALKMLHVAKHIQPNPEIDYAIGYASFKLEDFEGAVRGFWYSTCFYIDQKKKPNWANEHGFQNFSCDSYFMWALSEAMQNGEVGWSNCWKYCNFVIDDMDNDLLPKSVENKCAPLVDFNDYQAAFRLLRMFSGIFSNEASSNETISDLEVLFSKLEVAPHSIDELQNYIEACHETGVNKEKAKELWETKIRPIILSDKSGVSI